MKIAGKTAAAIAMSVERQLRAAPARSGTGLPTVRGLARRLQVSPATVAAAYRQLRARGLIVGAGRRGTQVGPRLARSRDIAASRPPDGAVDLASGQPDPALLPPIEPALAALRLDSASYAEGSDDPGLLRFAAGEFEADGIAAGHLAVTGGALDAIDRVLQEYLRPGDRVGIEDPTFPGLTDLVVASGLIPTPVAVDAQGPRPEAVEQALAHGCAALVVTPRAQNPTGAAVDEGRSRELRRVLGRASHLVVIENDYAAPIAGAPMWSLQAAGRRWAVVRSTGKFLGPDLRVALLAGDAITVARVRDRQALGTRWVSHLLQRLALALWSDPSGGRRLARAAEIYRVRREALRAALGRQGIAVLARSGFNVWVPVRDEGRVVHALATRGWAVAPGERFRIRSRPAIRVTASTLDPTWSERFAADLAEVLRPTRSTLV